MVAPRNILLAPKRERKKSAPQTPSPVFSEKLFTTTLCAAHFAFHCVVWHRSHMTWAITTASVPVRRQAGCMIPTYTANPSSATSLYIRYSMKKMNLMVHVEITWTSVMNSMYTQFSNQSLHLVHYEENESNGTRGNNLDTGDELTTVQQPVPTSGSSSRKRIFMVHAEITRPLVMNSPHSSATSPFIRYITKKMNLYGTCGNNLDTGELTTQWPRQNFHIMLRASCT